MNSMNEKMNISYIATKVVTTDTGFAAVNPENGQELPTTFSNNSIADVDKACEKAQKAFAEYSQLSGKVRSSFIKQIVTQLQLKTDAIVQRAMLESGLPEMRLTGELGRTCGQLNMFASMLDDGSWMRPVIDTADPQRQPVPKPDVRLTVVPVGVVAVFGASNFPLAFSVAGGDTASALAAGCPVIVKSHSAHPGTSILVAQAINEAIEICHMPEGVFSLISGDRSVGTRLVNHPSIKAVGFTGSTTAGRALFNECASRPEPIPFFGELGSTNPVFLLPNQFSEDIEGIAQGFVTSMAMGCGQFCTQPGLIVALKGESLNRFLDLVKEKLPTMEAQTMLTAGISTAYADGAKAMRNSDGVEHIAQGVDGALNQATSQVLKVSAETWLKSSSLEEEVFGPLSLVIECTSADQMLAIVEKMHGHLTATLHANNADLANSKQLIESLKHKVGRVILNNWPTGVEVCQAMQHGGPYPAATFSPTSVGGRAIDRWVRPVSYQGMPEELLPVELRNENELGLMRLVNGEYTNHSL